MNKKSEKFENFVFRVLHDPLLSLETMALLIKFYLVKEMDCDVRISYGICSGWATTLGVGDGKAPEGLDIPKLLLNAMEAGYIKGNYEKGYALSPTAEFFNEYWNNWSIKENIYKEIKAEEFLTFTAK